MNKKILLISSIVLLFSASAFSKGNMIVSDNELLISPDSSVAAGGGFSPVVTNEPIVSVYPNPIKNSLNISYKVPVASTVSISVFNILGKEVLPLFKGMQQAGNYQKQFTLSSDLDAGVYFVKVTTPNKEFITKLIVQ